MSTESKQYWWKDEKNLKYVMFPYSLVGDGESFVASSNNPIKNILGDRLKGVGQGKTEEEAVNKMFENIRINHDYEVYCRLDYQRFVPFRKGDWRHKGGKWVLIFGIHIYFRYGKNMRGGKYIPFTKINVSISNYWKIFNKYKNERRNP